MGLDANLVEMISAVGEGSAAGRLIICGLQSNVTNAIESGLSLKSDLEKMMLEVSTCIRGGDCRRFVHCDKPYLVEVFSLDEE